MTIWISWELPLFILERLDILCAWISIRVKCYYHLNFSRAFVVHFRAPRYTMGLTHTPDSKVTAVWICLELSCSISIIYKYYAPESTSEWNVMTFWISRELSLFIFVPLDISWDSHIHSSQKLWSFEYVESLRVQFRPSRYIMRRNRRAEWKVMTIWISQELPLIIFEHVDIWWASHIHPSQKVWAFKFYESLCVQFWPCWYIMSQNRRSEWKVMAIWISWELPWFIFECLAKSWASHIHPSQKL